MRTMVPLAVRIIDMTGEYTMKLLDMVDEGILDPKAVMEACLCYMAEYQVEDMMRVNDFLFEEEEENE